MCRRIYGAATITYGKAVERRIRQFEQMAQATEGMGGILRFPVCIAKTQYSFTADPSIYGCPSGFNIHIRDLVINCGAEMVVAIAGEILRMPGLPRSPQAERIDIVDGQVEGLS